MTVPNAKLPEAPLERLNYYNSQRLEAVDFRLEQQYHMRVRRCLNRALYSAGIASGLEVKADPADKHAVRVSPGLALDADGREIILLEERIVRVRGTPRRADGVQFGNYLVIAYGESKVAPLQDGCRVQPGKPAAAEVGCCGGSRSSCSCGGQCSQCGGDAGVDLSWGAPSRIRNEPAITMQDAWPSEQQGKTLLAQIVMNEQCQVVEVRSGMRRYATAIKPPNTTPISLEGEKDIDKDNPKVLRFHVEGGFPDTALLYLQGFAFSSLYYTELGRHTHTLTVTLDPAPAVAPHVHSLDAVKTTVQPAHTHTVKADTDDSGNGIELESADQRSDLTTQVDMELSKEAEHSHGFDPGTTTGTSGGAAAHNHTVHSSLLNAGVTDVVARTGGGEKALKHFNDLRVQFDGADITPQILAQLVVLDPGWTKLGDGQPTHELVKNGTGAIDLRQLGVDLSPGAHTLVFAVSAGGGQLHYNLYVS
ncbi:MAG: hypothetical protein JNN30_08810 [Rhodanobacteraceae bacterium]|nr:hypothetical protein [Rhodanobacteraceae bacterium]